MEIYRIEEGVALYYLTFTVLEWLPVFVVDEPCLIVTESLNYCHQHKSLRINAFVIMPTHLHLILFDHDFNNERLQRTIRDMRQYSGRPLADYCEQSMPAVFGQVIRGTKRTDRARQFWQPSRHPVAIWSAAFWQTKVRYIHENPLRKGLVWDVTGWRFSSAAYWLLDPPGETDVLLSAIE
jgi:putative transposase